MEKEEIVPTNRLYIGKDLANGVGERRDDKPIILEIDSKKAYQDGVKFYIKDNKIYLADYIEPIYIKVIEK